MKFTVEFVEYMALVFVRISMIIAIAPMFSNINIPRRVKAAIAFFFSLVIINTVDYTTLQYSGIFGYLSAILSEAITGALIGLGSGFCLYILEFSGHMVDMEIGFAMAMEMDPNTSVQTTITSTILSSVFMLMFIVSDMHYFVIDALCDSYKLIPVGGAKISPTLYQIFTGYMIDYFTIGFRIILPIFSCILVVNVVLGILAKVAPQMNMFVIGMQLKVFIGLFLLFVTMSFLPGITDFLFEEMQKLTKLFMHAIA